jgi:hypothetical protein
MTINYEGDAIPVACENGCPDGYQGAHDILCAWAGRWFLPGIGAEVKILGAAERYKKGVCTRLVCVQAVTSGAHYHVEADQLAREEIRL